MAKSRECVKEREENRSWQAEALNQSTVSRLLDRLTSSSSKRNENFHVCSCAFRVFFAWALALLQQSWHGNPTLRDPYLVISVVGRNPTQWWTNHVPSYNLATAGTVVCAHTIMCSACALNRVSAGIPPAAILDGAQQSNRKSGVGQ